MKHIIRLLFNLILYLIAFLALQSIALSLLMAFMGQSGQTIALAFIISGVLTILLFIATRWVKPRQFNMHNTTALPAIILLSLALLMPAEWFEELMQVEVPKEMERLFEQLLAQPLGFVAIGLIAPIAEEVVFRGAIQGYCAHHFAHAYNNKVLKRNAPWIAILISALLFALVHGNLAQGIHAFLMGLLLGWLCQRTGSILPGIVMHWTNNIAVFLQCNLLDLDVDATLSDMFHGNTSLMHTAVISSAVIAVIMLWITNRMLPSNPSTHQIEIEK